MVVLAEVFHRLKKKGFSTVFLADDKETSIADVLTESDFYSSNTDEIFDKIKAYQQAGEFILGVDRNLYLSEEFFRLEERINENDFREMTVAIVDTSGEAVDQELPYGPLDTLWDFDMELAAKHAFPAVNPLTSTSTVLEGLLVESSHLEIQQKARKTLRRYKELRFLINNRGPDGISEYDRLDYVRGERLEAYLTQPFFVAENFTRQVGKSVSLATTIKDVKAILQGDTDEMDINLLKFTGELR
ncbi:hypothetical protein [Sediminibacillus albus]|uniref:hypothetical protein n=1 Tax=Sediminibacillus albus TaxID=407036 RepID=UPI000AF211A6